MIRSRFCSILQPSTDFNCALRTISQSESASKVGSSKSIGFPAKTASLSWFKASGTVSGRLPIMRCSFSRKPGAATGTECNPWIGVKHKIVEGTRDAFRLLKKVRRFGRFAACSSFSHFCLALKQVFFLQWFFLRLAMPTLPRGFESCNQGILHIRLHLVSLPYNIFSISWIITKLIPLVWGWISCFSNDEGKLSATNDDHSEIKYF
jgi:hypothetical protein